MSDIQDITCIGPALKELLESLIKNHSDQLLEDENETLALSTLCLCLHYKVDVEGWFNTIMPAFVKKCDASTFLRGNSVVELLLLRLVSCSMEKKLNLKPSFLFLNTNEKIFRASFKEAPTLLRNVLKKLFILANEQTPKMGTGSARYFPSGGSALL